MNTEASSKRLLLTPLQWVVAGVLTLLVVAFGVVLTRMPPRDETPFNWMYPGSLWVNAASSPTGIMAYSWISSDPYTNISAWYGIRLGVRGNAGSVYSVRPRGIPIFSRRVEYASACHNTTPGPWQYAAFSIVRDNEVLLISLTHRTNETNTCIQISRIGEEYRNRTRRNYPSIAGLTYPGNSSTTISSGGNWTSQKVQVVPAKLTAVASTYQQMFAPLTNVAANARRVHVIPLMRPTGLTNAMDMLYVTNGFVGTIHLLGTSNQTEIAINVAGF